MRELKFRAWNTDYTKPIFEYFTLNDFNKLEYLADKEIQQFTGLQDKNGKEIYESDLFRNIETGSTFEVYYGKNSACFRAKRLEDGWHFDLQKLFPIDNWEVVGNRFENENLLEG